MRDLRNLAVSDIWRVILHGNVPESPRPQALVSVVRVDSYHSPKLAPRLQASVKVDQARIAFVNQSANTSGSGDGELAALVFDNTVMGVDCWSLPQRANVRLNCRMQATFVDLHMLASHHVLLPTKMAAHSFLQSNEGQGLADLQLRLHQVCLRGGHFLAESVRHLTALWATEEDGFPAGISLYNATHSPLQVGQADTGEALALAPDASMPYVWRSQKARLMLRCSSESALQPGTWRWSEPFSLREGVIVVRILHDGYQASLVISMRKATATKYEVTFNGLMSTVSFLKANLEVRVILKKSFAFLANLAEGNRDDLRSITRGQCAKVTTKYYF